MKPGKISRYRGRWNFSVEPTRGLFEPVPLQVFLPSNARPPGPRDQLGRLQVDGRPLVVPLSKQETLRISTQGQNPSLPSEKGKGNPGKCGKG